MDVTEIKNFASREKLTRTEPSKREYSQISSFMTDKR